MHRERRFHTAEVRAIGDDATPRISGYAATFNQRSQDLGGFIEVIAPGAFDDVLRAQPDVLGLFNHDMDHVLGRTGSGTMRIAVDERGLRYEIDPPDTQLARDLMTSMRRGDIRSSSFAFSVRKDDQTWELRDGQQFRTINKVSGLYDCSVVTDPAYLSADSSVRCQLPQHDTELQAYVAEVRSRLQQQGQTDGDPLAGLQWRMRAHLLLEAAELSV